MAVIQSLRGAKQVLELNLENLDEKRAASADARSGTFFLVFSTRAENLGELVHGERA